MKKILYLAFVAIITFTACSKKGNTPAPVATTVVINGTTYPTVVIGSQTWTAVNYNGDGGLNYNNSATNIPADGKLYTPAEAAAITLPSGWRLPTAADYNNLFAGLGGVQNNTSNYGVSQAIALELMSTTGWTDTNGNNKLGFNARPVGECNTSSNLFTRAGMDAFFMIDNPSQNVYTPLSVDVSADQTEVNYFFNNSGYHISVRFVKDN